MTDKEFEDIIGPLALLPRDQYKFLRESLLGNFKKWKNEKAKKDESGRKDV